jgi:hypothetical protein
MTGPLRGETFGFNNLGACCHAQELATWAIMKGPQRMSLLRLGGSPSESSNLKPEIAMVPQPPV